MEDFQAMSQQFEAEGRNQVQRLKDLVSQVRSLSFVLINYELILVCCEDFSISACVDLPPHL
jgi:hypothetical protein